MSEDIAVLGIKVTSKDVLKATKRLNKLESQGKKTEKTNKKLGGSFNALKGAVGAFAASLVVKKFFATAAAFETMAVSLETVTGSAEKAEMAMQGIKDLAKSTPFSVRELTESFIKLKALGIAPTEEKLVSFGNTASAMGKSLNQMIEAVADAATGEFERLKEFGIKAKSEGDKVAFTFQGVTTTVGKNSKEITNFLESIGNTKFAGAMSKQMDTLAGKTSILNDSIDDLIVTYATLGSAQGGKGALDFLIDGVNGLTDIVKIMPRVFTSVFTTIETAVVKSTAAFKTFGNSIINVFDSSDRLIAQKAIDNELERELSILNRTTQAYIERDKAVKKSQATASLNVAGAADTTKQTVFSGDAFGTSTEQGDPNSLQTFADELNAEREIQKEHRDLLLEQESEYFDNLFGIERDSKQASIGFADSIRDMDIKSSLRHGSAMLQGAAKTNKKAFELQKTLALANVAVTLPSAVMKSFENGGGYPWGLIPAGLMMAQGLSQIQSIRSTSFGGGGSPASVSGGGGGSTGAPTGAASAPSLPAGQPTENQRELRVTVEGDGPHSEGMRRFAENLSETIKDMGGTTNLVLT